MNPRGPIPHCLSALDDQVFDGQCLADTCNEMAHHLLSDLALFWTDRAIDLDEVRHLARDMERLDRFTDEECCVLRTVRASCNDALELFRRMRAHRQKSKKAAVNGLPNELAR